LTGFDVGTRHVGDGAPCLIVAEVAQAHEGSLQIAHAYIDAIADAGADAVKFQCHIAEAESTPDEAWRIPPRWREDGTRYEYWKRMEFTPFQWSEMAGHAKQRGLAFIVSPFSIEAVAMVGQYVDSWKVASGEVTNGALWEAIVATGKPALFSSGMSTKEELQRAIWFFPTAAVLQCTSRYPCPPELVGLNMLQKFRGWGRPIGLSDHSGTIYAGLAAVALGCDVLEVHVKLSKHDQGFDASSSITIEELKQLVEGVRFIEKAKQPVDKDALSRELAPMRELFMGRAARKAAYDAR